MQVFFARWESGRSVKWRSLKWAEFNKFDQQLNYRCPAAVYNDVYRAVVLEGPPLEGDPIFVAPAGLVEWIARSLLDQNPFNGEYENVKRALDMKRAELRAGWLNSAKAVIAGIFRYTFEEIEQWDAEQFFERLAAAEFVSGRKLEPGNPEDEKTTRPRQIARKQLTPSQERTIDRVHRRDQGEEAPPRSKPVLSPAQQQVADRVRQRS